MGLAFWESRKPARQTTREIRIIQAVISATKLCRLFCFFPYLGSVLPTLICSVLWDQTLWDATGAPGSPVLAGSQAGNPAGREGAREGGLLGQISTEPGGRRQDQTSEGDHLLVLPQPGFL